MTHQPSANSKRHKKHRPARKTVRLFRELARQVAPPPVLSLSEWMSEHYRLSAESSAVIGRFRPYPYQVGMLDAVTEPGVKRITIMKSARVGYTKMLNGIIGYHIHQDPCPMLLVQPTVEDAQGYSKDELAPMFEEVDVLRARVSEQKSRNSKSTILKKTFAGGSLNMTGANSARGFRRLTVRKALYDEVDGYPPTAGQEGDQIKLGDKRTDTYWNKQSIIGSTPTVKGTSRVENSFEKSDKRYFHVPCPFCDHLHVLRWADFDFGGKGKGGTLEDPKFICPSCDQAFGYEHHHRIIARGQWIATAPFAGHAGFHIWAAYSYSPSAVWAELAQEFLDVKSDPAQLQTFVNTVLGETWEERGEQLDEDIILRRCQHYYHADAPDGVLVLVASVDTQDDRLEVEVKGFGRGNENWGIEYTKLVGSMTYSAQPNPDNPTAWDMLDALIERTYRRADGTPLRIARVVIDSGGHHAGDVYRYCKKREARGVYAIKGQGGDGVPLVGNLSRNNRERCALFMIGTDAGKTDVHTNLQQDHEGLPGFMHFPMEQTFADGRPRGYDRRYVEGVLAETRHLRYKKGVAYHEWICKKGVRNEPLDLNVYLLAAIQILNPNWDVLERQRGQVAPPAAAAPRPRGRRVVSRGIGGA